MQRLKKALCLTAILGMMGAVWGCEEKIAPGHTSPKATRTLRAPVAVVETSGRADDYEAVGTVIARVFAHLSSKLMGVVREVRVEEGDRVQQGDLLVVIDARQVAAHLEQAQATLEEARRAEASARAAREAARAAARLAETTYERYRRLLEEESVARQEFDEVETRLNQARAALGQAEAMLAAAQNRVQQAGAAVKAAAVSRSDAVIEAPYAGRITRKRVHAGDLASPGMLLLTIEKAAGFQVVAAIPEEKIKRVTVGNRVRVTVPALDTKPIEGVVSRIVPDADERSRSFQIKVDLPEMKGLRSGMFARVAVPLERTTRLAVPKKAVLFHGQLAGVFIVDEADTARFRLVRTGKKTGERIEILSGLREGMRYVVDPPPGLVDGMKVEASS